MALFVNIIDLLRSNQVKNTRALFDTHNKARSEMANLTVSEAAKLVNKNRSTIQRYIQSGKLSAAKDANGVFVIDTAELVRVFGSDIETPIEIETVVQNENDTALMTTIELLREQLKAAQVRENKLLAMLESEQEARRQLEQKLLPPGKEEVIRSDYSKKRGFFARLFGK